MALALAGLLLGRAPAVSAGGVTFKITVKSAFLRSEPRVGAAKVLSVFRGEVYPLIGRSADNGWVLLQVSGQANGAWAVIGIGEVRGALGVVPILAGAGSGSATPAADASAPAASAPASGVFLRMTITAKSTFVRAAPTWGAARIGSAFKGQTYTAIGRSTDPQWVQIQFGNRLGWAAASVGRLSGDISLLAATDDVTPGQTNAAWVSGSGGGAPWIPVLTPYIRSLYESAPQFGRGLNLFAAVGDCNSESPVYLQRVREGRFNFTGREDLRATADFFAASFQRDGLATYGSFNTGAVLHPDWGNPGWCRPGEGAFVCELRVSQASIVFIALGTGDQYTWRDAEKNYRTMIEYATNNGVLPVLVTKADEVESVQGDAEPGYLNSVMRRLAQEYQIPLLDFWLATRSLPNYGLKPDGFHLNEDGINLHILVTLQTLEAIRKK
jgi:hypothetical protein